MPTITQLPGTVQAISLADLVVVSQVQQSGPNAGQPIAVQVPLSAALAPSNGAALPKAGGTMTGVLTLAGDPAGNLDAATKQYADTHGTGKVTLTQPATGSTVTVDDGKTLRVSATLTLNGTNGDTITFPAGSQTLAGRLVDNVFGTSSGSTNQTLLSSVAGNSTLYFDKPGGHAWKLMASGDAQTGRNAGSLLDIYSFSDTGGLIGQLFGATRGSGYYGTGIPYWNQFAPYTMTAPRAVAPGGVIGNLVNFANDAQPTATLAANPIATTNGSPTVTITWVGSSASGGPLSASVNTWVNLTGVVATGGITPTGWLEVVATPTNDTFTVTWTSNATSTVAAGGGSSVTVTPSSQVQTDLTQSNATSPAGGFAIQKVQYYFANPSAYITAPSSKSANFAAHFAQVYSPPETSGTKSFATSYCEVDVINRGDDTGYSPNLYIYPRNTVGYFVGPLADVAGFVPGGGTGHNWNTMFSLFSAGGRVAVYDFLSVQPNSLVGASNDPILGHGGVGYDAYGAFEQLGSGPFTTTNGSNVVTVQVAGGGYGGIQSATTGDMLYIPLAQTINGVTFGGTSYAITITNKSAGLLTIVGTGNASSSGVGGGTGQWAAFARLVPYSPVQFYGEWKHGIITTNFKSDDGLIVSTQPGNGVGWGDGTGTASITGTAVSVGNISVDLTPAGTGLVNAKGLLGLKAYTVATLPAAAAGNVGCLAYVTDATAPTYRGALTGGGAVKTLVMSDGAAWTSH